MHLRVTRDHRGFQHTFLVRTVQRGGKKQTRILYWFRSPVDVRVGRTALDEEALRAIETSHPGRTFSWERIREPRPAAEPPPAPPAPQGDPGRHTGRPAGHDARRRVRAEASAMPEPPQPPPQRPAGPSGPARRRGRGGRGRQAPPGPVPAAGPGAASPATDTDREEGHGGGGLG
jgi:hypothetical protein